MKFSFNRRSLTHALAYERLRRLALDKETKVPTRFDWRKVAYRAWKWETRSSVKVQDLLSCKREALNYIDLEIVLHIEIKGEKEHGEDSWCSEQGANNILFQVCQLFVCIRMALITCHFCTTNQSFPILESWGVFEKNESIHPAMVVC